MIVPPHDVWLRELDLAHEGIVTALIDTSAFGQAGIIEDLEGTKNILIEYAGKSRARCY